MLYLYKWNWRTHALECIERMNIKNNFTKVYSRDTIPFMKPDFRSFKSVHNDIYRGANDIFLFFLMISWKI